MRLCNALPGSFACMVLAACLDLSPGKFVPPNPRKDAGGGTSPDAGQTDGGGPDPATVERLEQCRMCLTGGACSQQSTGCNADERCAIFFTCLTERDCWKSKIVDFNNVAPCLTECAAVARFTSQLDPSTLLVMPVFACAQDVAGCASSCAPTLE